MAYEFEVWDSNGEVIETLHGSYSEICEGIVRNLDKVIKWCHSEDDINKKIIEVEAI